MLKTIGFSSMDSFIEAVIPRNILEKDKVDLEISAYDVSKGRIVHRYK